MQSAMKMETRFPLLEYFEFLQDIRTKIRSNDEFNHHCNMLFVLTLMFLLLYLAYGAFMKVIKVDEISIIVSSHHHLLLSLPLL